MTQLLSHAVEQQASFRAQIIGTQGSQLALSGPPGWQTSWLQPVVQGWQSVAQVEQVSLPLHVPSPHIGAQAPQSVAQVEQVSLPLHILSPQVAPDPELVEEVLDELDELDELDDGDEAPDEPEDGDDDDDEALVEASLVELSLIMPVELSALMPPAPPFSALPWPPVSASSSSTMPLAQPWARARARTREHDASRVRRERM